MSFEDINNEIRSRGGGWTNLKSKGDKLAGKIVDVESRNQSFNGVVRYVTSDNSPRKGQPRKEWVFTLELPNGDVTKWAAQESAQWAIMGALNGRKLLPGGHLQVEILNKEDRKQPDFKAVYTDPVGDSPFEGTPAVEESDEPPF